MGTGCASTVRCLCWPAGCPIPLWSCSSADVSTNIFHWTSKRTHPVTGEGQHLTVTDEDIWQWQVKTIFDGQRWGQHLMVTGEGQYMMVTGEGQHFTVTGGDIWQWQVRITFDGHRWGQHWRWQVRTALTVTGEGQHLMVTGEGQHLSMFCTSSPANRHSQNPAFIRRCKMSDKTQCFLEG